MEEDLSEQRSRYQSLLRKHLCLEKQHSDLKGERKLLMVGNTLVLMYLFICGFLNCSRQKQALFFSVSFQFILI